MWATVSSIEWLRKKPSVNPKVIPGRPSLRSGVKSLSIQLPPRHVVGQRTGERRRAAWAAKARTRGVVAGARLVHDRRPRRPGVVEVQHQADAARPRAAQEGLHAEQPVLLAVGQQDQHVAFEPGPGVQGARHLEQRRHAGPVVGRPGAHGDAVVVGDEQDDLAVAGRCPAGGARTLSTAGDDVTVVVGDDGGVLHPGAQPGVPETLDEEVAHAQVRGGGVAGAARRRSS